jgi:hypothetical protein
MEASVNKRFERARVRKSSSEKLRKKKWKKNPRRGGSPCPSYLGFS